MAHTSLINANYETDPLSFLHDKNEIITRCIAFANMESCRKENVFSWQTHFTKCFLFYVIHDPIANADTKNKLILWTKSTDASHLSDVEQFESAMVSLNKIT